MLIYFIKTLKGDFEGQSVEQVGVIFEGITANPWLMIGAMVLVVALCLGVCSFGLQNGVEKGYQSDDGFLVRHYGGAGGSFGHYGKRGNRP